MPKSQGGQGLNEQGVMEEAIADAFADFATNKPTGLMYALMRRLNSFFEALRNAFKGLGFTSANDVFTQVERGELKPAVEPTKGEEKLQLRESDIGHKREGASGRYVGAPDWVGDRKSTRLNSSH